MGQEKLWTDAIVKILNTVYYEEPRERRTDRDGEQDHVHETGAEKVGAERALTAVISEADIMRMLAEIQKLFLSQAACVEIAAPVKICGDTHGQYADVIRVFHHGGFPPTANYLFLGDYVDRGKNNLETVLLLFYYKLRFPHNMFLLRGNHETEKVNRVYGFYEECLRRYGSEKLYDRFQEVFRCMPLAALVGHRILCMHGGISPHLTKLSELAKLTRPTDADEDSVELDLLWADPVIGQKGFEFNERGASYGFGEDILTQFLKDNDLDMIARAHQVVQDGYEFFAGRRCVTLFSAPHYCGQFDNAAAIMTVKENLVCSFDIIRPLEHDAVVTTKTTLMTSSTTTSPAAAVPAASTKPPATTPLRNSGEVQKSQMAKEQFNTIGEPVAAAADKKKLSAEKGGRSKYKTKGGKK